MSDLIIDLVEDILLRLDAEDLIRCKSVCKSWLSFISSPQFVKTHLNYTCIKDQNNQEFGHKRIVMPSPSNTPDEGKYICDYWHIVGSANGLVCVSPVDDQVLVTNPSTREVRKLPPPLRLPNFLMDREFLCWGFGHDLSTDDYKVVLGTKIGKAGTLFQVFSLKSNTWKAIPPIYCKVVVSSRFGFLWNGALHWIMKICHTKTRVIISFDLSREEFKEIPKPDDSIYVCDYFNRLGILKGCLCIFRYRLPYKRWVMRNYNDKDSWCLSDDDCEMDNYDTTHTLYFSHKNWWLSDDSGKCLDSTRKYIGAPIFVKSLVSPHLNGRPKKTRRAKHNKRNFKAVSNYDVISRSFSFSLRILKKKRKTKNRNMKGISFSSTNKPLKVVKLT